MKSFSMDGFCELRSISCLKFSPKGENFCFVAAQADKAGNKYTSNIYRLQGKKLTRLTGGGKESSFQFLDEDTILFPGNREESKEPSLESHFYRLSLSGGEAEKVFTLPIPVQQLLPLPGGDFVVAAATVPGFEDLYQGSKKRAAEYLKFQKDNEDYEVVEQLPWWWNGSGFTHSGYTTLYYYSAKKNSLRPLTEWNFDVSGAQLNPEKTEVWFMGCRVQAHLSRDRDLYRIRLGEDKPERMAQSTPELAVEGFALGESFAVVLASDRKFGLNTDLDFYKLSYEDGSLSLYKKYGEAIGSSVGSDVRHGGGTVLKMVGDALYFISTIYDDAHLYKLENGEITQVTGQPGSVDSFDVCGGQVRVCALWGMRPQEIYTPEGTRLTRLNDKALAGKYVAQPQPLQVQREGYEVHGFVLPPMGYQPGQKYPVIFDIHGGPKTVYGPVFYHEMQLWAGMGYFVIYCNPTGSDGRNAFMDIRGKYGTVDYEDLMAFCDEALRCYPDMDAQNLFETGGSYGGFMTNWIIGHTDRFAACASQRSISNWFSFYGVSDIGVEFAQDQCLADPWANPEKLWEHSPLKYADRCKTPTLFIHSFEDYCCPIDQGYQMYTALVSHGVESKMVLFKGENHDLSRSGKPLHRIRRLEEITKWFELHKR